MIISRTPFRISFLGGGTDYPAWFREHEGAVLAIAINKYCYISVRHLPPFFEHKHRIVWSLVETVQEVEQIQHPAVRGMLEEFKIEKGLEIHHDSDLPARSGLGSSSSFVVGLLNGLYALQGRMVSKAALAAEAIRIEQSVLKENVGCQDQISASFGGFNLVSFHRDGSFDCRPVILPGNRREEFQDSLMLFFSGITRFASDIAKSKIDNFGKKKRELRTMLQLVGEGQSILQNPREPLERFGQLLHESWLLKKSLSDGVTTPRINEIYDVAMEAGASGGKLMGAGGGGFMVFVVHPEKQERVRERLKSLVEVKVGIDYEGSKIVVYSPNEAPM